MMNSEKIRVLDKGWIKYIGHMGSDEMIVESARMSTGKGFFGWFWEKDTFADSACGVCLTQHLWDTLPVVDDEDADIEFKGEKLCTTCWQPQVYNFDLGHQAPEVLHPVLTSPKLLGKKGQPRDFSLLEKLYSDRHSTPFESGELMVEVYAPIMVYREWHRHRSQSYNEFSARYAQMPNDHYLPELSRIQKQSQINKQGSAEAFDVNEAADIRNTLKNAQDTIYEDYDRHIRRGVAKEVARINTPVSRYSKMRAKANLRNWLWFLGLRMEKGAQQEIREYANVIAGIIQQIWPKTFELFIEHDFLSVRFSRTEMRLLRAIVESSYDRITDKADEFSRAADIGMSERKLKGFLEKLTKNKEDDYKDVLTKLGY